MAEIHYNRLLARSIYVFGIFTTTDLEIFMVLVIVPMVVFDSYTFLLIELIAHPMYIVAFRLGRPPGADIHRWKSYFYPAVLRPGVGERRPYVLPKAESRRSEG